MTRRGPQRERHLDRLGAVGGLGDDLEVGLGVEDARARRGGRRRGRRPRARSSSPAWSSRRGPRRRHPRAARSARCPTLRRPRTSSARSRIPVMPRASSPTCAGTPRPSSSTVSVTAPSAWESAIVDAARRRRGGRRSSGPPARRGRARSRRPPRAAGGRLEAPVDGHAALAREARGQRVQRAAQPELDQRVGPQVAGDAAHVVEAAPGALARLLEVGGLRACGSPRRSAAARRSSTGRARRGARAPSVGARPPGRATARLRALAALVLQALEHGVERVGELRARPSRAAPPSCSRVGPGRAGRPCA